MQYDFILNRRVQMSFDKRSDEGSDDWKKQKVVGYVVKIVEKDGWEKVFLIKDDGEVFWVISNGNRTIKNFDVTILDWDPNSPLKPKDRIDNKFGLLDV